MTLTADIGNSRTKIVIFDDDKPLYINHYTTITHDDLDTLYTSHPISRTILSSVNQAMYLHIARYLQARHRSYTTLTHHTPLPFSISYRTPHTLGLDRIAAVTGASVLHPDRPVLIIDAGTCITYDLYADRCFRGGNIAPGIRMRLDALHHYTAALPAIDPDSDVPPTGLCTATAMQAGAYWGAIYEIKGYISRYTRTYPALLTLITGGDAPLILDRLSDMPDIEHQPLLVPIGLNFLANDVSK